MDRFATVVALARVAEGNSLTAKPSLRATSTLLRSSTGKSFFSDLDAKQDGSTFIVVQAQLGQAHRFRLSGTISSHDARDPERHALSSPPGGSTAIFCARCHT
jgi:hypothetical protein